MQRIHGLVIRCTQELPGLSSSAAATPDVTLTIADAARPPLSPTVPLYRAAAEDPGDASVVVVRDARRTVCFRYSDGSSADVDLSTNPAHIEAVVGAGQTLEDLAAYLYGPVLGFVLRARGVLAMHASCVEVDGGAVLFAGDAGVGKSTTAASFAQRGHLVLSDDLTALRQDGDRFMAYPAFDHIRLWRESEEILCGRAHVLETITPTWEKLRFPLGDDAFGAHPLPVRAIYVIDDPGSTPEHPTIRPMTPRAALLSLMTLTYANYLLDSSTRAIELAQLGALVAHLPVHVIARHVDGSRLGAVRERIVDHVREMRARPER